MRSLQECQAEVFRRGERKIAKRRKRIRRSAGILLACVPLCLCLMLLPKNSKEEKAKDAPASTGMSVCYVEITGANSSYTLTASQEIQYFIGLMGSHSIQNSLVDGATGSVDTEPEAAPEISETHEETMHIAEDQAAYDEENFDRNMSAHETDKGHTITLFMDDGTEITYFLLENMLTDINTGHVTVLSRQQAEELRAFLEGKVEE